MLDECVMTRRRRRNFNLGIGLKVTGTLSPDVTGDYRSIGPQAANGDYDPTEPDADVYHTNINGQDWYIWHDSAGSEYFYISKAVGVGSGAGYIWYRAYASGITGDYITGSLVSGTATVAKISPLRFRR